MASRQFFAIILFAAVTVALTAPPVRAAQLTADQVIAALRRDPARLPYVPDAVTSKRGSEQPVSAEDRARGVLAYFAVVMNYTDPHISVGITYRVFGDAESAANYGAQMSTANGAAFKPAPGTTLYLFPATTDDFRWPGRRPYETDTCESFIAASDPGTSTTRCFAQHIDLPVVVSGIRIDPVQPQGSGKAVGYPGWPTLRTTQLNWAVTLLDEAMRRLDEIEQ